MKKVLNPAILLWLVGHLATAPLFAVGFSQEQWKQIFSKQIDGVLNSYYAFVGKNVGDVYFLAQRDLDQRVIVAALAAKQLEGIRRELEGHPDKPSTLLRQARLTLQTAQSIQAQAEGLASLLGRAQAARVAPCDARVVREFTRDFAASGAVEVKRILGGFQAQIQEVQDKGITAGGLKVQIAANTNGVTYGQVSGTGQASNVQEAVMGVSAMVGGAIGSAFFGVGAIVGSLLGSLIGTVLGAIISVIFFGNPDVALIGSLREQADFVSQAVQSIGAPEIEATAGEACRYFVQNPELDALANSVTAGWAKRMADVASFTRESKEHYLAIENQFQNELARLHEAVYPAVREFANASFESYFAALGEKSAESKKYANGALTGPLSVLLKASSPQKEKDRAERDLWAALLKGDACYSASKYFGFQTQSVGDARAVVAWDGIARAVSLKLEKLFESSEGGGAK